MSSLSLKVRNWMVPIPAFVWRRTVAKEARAMAKSLEFMTADHRRVRNLSVSALGIGGERLTERRIADQLELPIAEVAAILDELEKRLFFVWRDADRAVTWAYPVTVHQTPHELTFETGERMTAA